MHEKKNISRICSKEQILKYDNENKILRIRTAY